ncbi:MAG: DUF3102 domain-containing protein [Eubacteriales bacterium]|nr:DUF3102 domain-containing protein [Eubacteriales bacterium]
MSKEIIEVDYKVVPERTLDIIAIEIKTIDNHVCQVALSGAVAIGTRLEEAKEQVGHGKWEEWCRENLNYSKSKAERFMKIALEYGNENSPYLAAISKTSTLTDFSISKALKLLLIPEDEVEAFAGDADIGNTSVRELEAKIKQLEAEKEEIGDELVASDSDLKMVEDHLAAAEAEKERLETELEAVKAKVDRSPEESEELEKARTEIEKIRKKLKTAEAKVKDAEAEKQRAMEEAAIKVKQEAKSEAEAALSGSIEALKAVAEEAEKKVLAAENKMKVMSNEDVARFKVKVDDTQEAFSDALLCIKKVAGADPEQAEKMSNALKTVLKVMSEQF